MAFRTLAGGGAELGSRASSAVGSVFRWRAYPWIVQWALLVGVAAVVLLALRTPRHAELNPGAAIVWQLWWPLLPFFILLTSRLWCAICPFPLLGDAAQRLRTSPSPPLPSPALRRIGPWVAAIALGVVGFLFLLLQVESSGPLTAVLLLVIAVAAVGTALAWRRRVWCRYLCPLGLMAGLYARLGWLRLEPGEERGKAAATARRCPVYTSALAQRRAHDCVLCAECLRGQGSEAVRIRVGRPSLTRLSLMPAEAVAVSLLLGLLLADALRMTPLYVRYMAWAVPVLGVSYGAAMALGIGGVVAMTLLVQGASARALSRGESLGLSFVRLSLLWLPVVVAAHLALSAQHLLGVGAVAQSLGAEIGLLLPGHVPPADAYAEVWPMRAFLWSVLALGGGVAFWLARRLTPRGGVHGWSAAGVLPALPLLGIFGQPMAIAC